LLYRGQEEAPFQLLVAVILMTFVIVVGMNAITEAEKQKCFNDTEKLMNDFKLAIEKTATYKQPSNLKFDPPSCTKNEKFVIVKTDEERICKETCLNSSSSCILLRYKTPEVTGIPDKCINVSWDTQFWNSNPNDHPTECGTLQDYLPAVIDSSEGIKRGVYQFFYYSSPGVTHPAICSFIRK
jgi:hypothetical protein